MTTATQLYTNGKLQEAIMERVDEDNVAMSLQDMSSGCDPIYQFAGWIWTHDMVVDAYNEYKEDVIEAITELASYDHHSERQARTIIEWEPFRSTPRPFDTHADFAGRCLAIAITYHAGELFAQVDQ